MQLPPAGPASPRTPAPGSSPVPQAGGAAGFDAVMNGVLASDAKTSGGAAQQAPDGGAQETPAAGGSGTIAPAAKPEVSKAAKDAVDAAGSPDPAGAGADTGAAVAVAGVFAMIEAAPGTAAPQAVIAVAVPGKERAVDGAVPAKAIAARPATASLVVGMAAGNTQATLTAKPAPSKASGTSALAPSIPAPSIPVPSIPVLPVPDSTVPDSTGPQPTGPLPSSTLPAGLELKVTATEAQPRMSGTAVVLPTGKPATQQDPQRIPGQDAQAAAAPGHPSGIQAGLPVVPPVPFQQAPSSAAPGMATPTPQAHPAKLLPQVSGPLFSLASAAPGTHVMTLKLSPEDLGPLTVRARIEGAAVRIELFAPGEAGREAVRSILPELRRGLGESGFGASLDLSEHNAPADAGASGSDPRGSDARDRRPAESTAFPRGSDGEAVRLPRTAVVLPRSSTSSLDILV